MSLKLLFSLFFLLISKLNAEEVMLRPHQQYTLDYLLKNAQQKGILLYHSLGSGKTILALSYAESFQNKPIIVISPRFLKSNWLMQMEKFHVKNFKRYELISFEEAGLFLQKRDLSQAVVIIDEAHKLIDKIRFGRSTESAIYADLYQNLTKAYKIVALTGTPIYNKASDVSYLAHLVSGKETYPLNEEVFRSQYMFVKPDVSLVRGYVLESKLTYMFFPGFALFATMCVIGSATSFAIPIVAFLSSAALPKLAEWNQIPRVSFRDFNPLMFREFSEKYISFHETKEEDLAFFPEKRIHEKEVPYTSEQTHFYLDFIDQILVYDQLKILLQDTDIKASESQFHLNGHKIMQDMLVNDANGREIGNLSLPKKNGDGVVESNKFLQILETMQKTQGKIAIYSNYYQNGILAFSRFLDAKGYKGQYVVLSPEDPVDIQIKNILLYNENKTKIMLIHPEITEGISLLGTRQLHIMEPVVNTALQEQIIGRAVRFKSHEMLPPSERSVDIYLWKSTLDYSNEWSPIPSEADYIRKEHWRRNFSEVNINNWTNGIALLDRNFFWKEETPDQRIKRKQDIVFSDMEGFKELARNHSIESLK